MMATKYVPLCNPHRIDATTPMIPLTASQYDGLVAVHGSDAVATMYAPEDDELVALIRRVADHYIAEGQPVMCQRMMRPFRRSMHDGGFDAEGFRKWAGELLGERVTAGSLTPRPTPAAAADDDTDTPDTGDE